MIMKKVFSIFVYRIILLEQKNSVFLGQDNRGDYQRDLEEKATAT